MSRKKILLVDDEVALLKTLRRRLELNNYEVVEAQNGEEGLAKARSEQPDLIISDVMMPKMDGYTFIRKLRQEPSLAATPVIILTAKPHMKDLFVFEGIKECDYIVKPFRSDELLKKIEQLLLPRVQTHLEPEGKTEPPSPAA